MTPSLFPEYPFVIPGKINNWKILKFSENDWCNEFRDKKLIFRQGNKTFEENPCWEQQCENQNLTMREFFERSSVNGNKWLYFDYKYVKDIFTDSSSILKDINWADLNLFNLQGQDSTFWIGNEGAHTPCHMDSYGCNFVAQIFGRKLWILMPPQETDVLDATRVPYEESSVYSSFNFYTPCNNLLNIRKAFKIVLSPGEVLFVPRHWWHYVENLEVAISCNIWVPLDLDHESRLEESLIRHYIFNVCQDLSEEEAKQLLNPNEYHLLTERNTFDTLQTCVNNCIQFREMEKGAFSKDSSARKFSSGDTARSLQQTDLKSYVEEKSKQFNYDPSAGKTSPNKLSPKVFLVKNLINSYGHPSNVSSLKEALIKRLMQ